MGLRRFGLSTNIKTLKLRKLPKISNLWIRWISDGCRFLQYIDLSDSDILDSSLEYLSNGCSRLRSFIINDCKQVTDEGFCQFIQVAGKYLNEIQIQRCLLITDKGIRSITEHCNRLKHLDIQGVTNVTNNGILILSKACRQLEFLDISVFIRFSSTSCQSRVPHVTGEGLSPLGQYSHLLKVINCSGVSKIEKFGKIACGCPNLTKISLRYCYDIVDTDLNLVSTHCIHLTFIDLGFCNKLSDNSVILLASKCTNLEYVSLHGCFRITNASIVAFANFCHQLQSLDLNSVENINDKILVNIIENLTQLRFLDLTLTSITCNGIFRLERHLHCALKVSRKSMFRPLHKSLAHYRRYLEVNFRFNYIYFSVSALMSLTSFVFSTWIS